MIPRLWRPGPFSGLLRAPLLLPAALYRLGATARNWRGLRATVGVLPRPAIMVGNLTVGGTGKTPVVGWLVTALAHQGVRAGVIVHPAARDEAVLHAALPGAPVVVVDRDRRRGAADAAARGAEVLIFDDGAQHPGLTGAFRILLLSAEQDSLSRWPPPAGPWRQDRRALATTDLVVVTRKTVTASDAEGLADRVASETGRPVARAHLGLDRLSPLRGGAALPLSLLRGARVLAVAGVADPIPFRDQLVAHGASVRLRAFRDHHHYGWRDVAAVLEESRATDYVVVTSKDAVKLRIHWPAAPEPLVAELAVHWEGAIHPELSAAGCRWSA